MNARDQLALALDVDGLDAAVGIAEQLRPWFGIAKVGLELYATAGNDAVAAMRRLGYDVFLDLKLHDIPTTVRKAARVLGRLGVRYVTMHASGGAEMLRAGNGGLAAGAAEAGHAPPVVLGVTVLTSDPDSSPFDSRLAVVAASGCGGVVCSALEVASVKSRHPHLVTVVPGIRLAGGAAHDQARVGTPEGAIRDGADVLVIGRAVTAAPDPVVAAGEITAAVAAATG
ncbi:MAG: orotidine-5'-phosphate decarboxylase [Acidimicrobiia bacterium]